MVKPADKAGGKSNPDVPEALAHCLATEGKGGPVVVAGLGIFHLRHRDQGSAGKVWGVLFLLAPEMRAALSDEPDSADVIAQDRPDRGVSFQSWLALRSGLGDEWAADQIASFVSPIRDAVLAAVPYDAPGLGTFALKITVPKTLTNPQTGETVPVGPRKAICFEMAESLRRRLDRKLDS